MIALYKTSQSAFINSNGAQGVPDADLLLNIIIELRAMNAITLDMQNGVVTQSLQQYRADAVTETVA